ncbi:uncharacterized protein BXZ73DRAFT_38442 [Epithele typhae]|uniref:uncharacterized protein n=1 Tax=Epithele typhae TaxID=378194 RepID=UPI002007F679|nr:uncharacterized protein BXZ73DRAFT_38442 [Epithele typhae]KAH9945263.1 hypothetical protein BXZ73DRAFT_38442 [Epithele typhae]
MPVLQSNRALDGLSSANSRFSLDFSGLAGFLGGDLAVSAMLLGSLQFFPRTYQWLGWYNSHGGYAMPKFYKTLLDSSARKTRRAKVDPAVLLGLNDLKGPSFYGILSETVTHRSGHFANLLMAECDDMGIIHCAAGRKTTPHHVTVVDMRNLFPNIDKIPKTPGRLVVFFTIFPIGITIAASILSLLIAEDWFAFGLICSGALANGISRAVLGLVDITVDCPQSSTDSPPGDGVLGGEGTNIVVVLGPQKTIDVITRGAFRCNIERYSIYPLFLACVLLALSFLAQLVLVPACTVFGQLMFLASLIASWLYTLYLSSSERKHLQGTILLKHFLGDPGTVKVELGTRTMTVAFIARAVKNSFNGIGDNEVRDESLGKLLHQLLQNDTPSWRQWKSIVLNSVFSDTDIHEGPDSSDTKLVRQLTEDTEEGFRLADLAMDKLEGAGVHFVHNNYSASCSFVR